MRSVAARLGVQAHVDQRELHRRSVCRPLWFSAIILSKRARGSSSPPSTWAMSCSTSHSQQVLHELARQLDRIPLDAGDARQRQIVDARQHVVQAVANSWKRVCTVVVRQQRRAAVQHRRAKLHTRCHRRLQLASGRNQPFARASIQAPGRLPGLAWGRGELADQLGCGVAAGIATSNRSMRKKRTARVPHRRLVGRIATLEQRLDDAEQAVENPGSCTK